jgi:hypothetical protein
MDLVMKRANRLSGSALDLAFCQDYERAIFKPILLGLSKK